MTSKTNPSVVHRQAARVILLDSADRLLLFHYRDPASQRAFWITPGGGVEAGETFEEAARRELYEETGLAGLRFSSCV